MLSMQWHVMVKSLQSTLTYLSSLHLPPQAPSMESCPTVSNTVPLPRMFHPAPLELQYPLIQVLIEPSSQILHTCSLFQEAFFGHKYHLPALFSMTVSTSPVGLLCSDSTTARTRFTSCPFPPTPRKLFMPSTTTAWATETSMRLLYNMMPRDVTQVN